MSHYGDDDDIHLGMYTECKEGCMSYSDQMKPQDRADDGEGVWVHKARLAKGIEEAREGRTVTRPEFPDPQKTRKVLVHGLPGYSDFTGELVAVTDAMDERGKLTVVRMVLNDPLAEPSKAEYAVVPMSCVYVRMDES